MADLEDLIIKIKTDLNPLNQGVQQASQSLNNFANNSVNGLSQSLGVMQQGALMAMGALEVLVPIQAIGSLHQIIEKGNEFQKTLGYIREQTGATTDQVNEMGSAIMDLSNNLGSSASDIAETTKQIDTLGLSTQDTMKITEEAAEAAKGTGSSYAAMATLATLALRNFKDQNIDSAQAMDMLTEAMLKSNTRAEEWERVFGHFGPEMDASGTSLKDFIAMVETLSNTMGSASVGNRAFQSMFSSIIEPSKEAQEEVAYLNGTLGTNIELSMQGVQAAGGLEQWLLKLKDALDKSGDGAAGAAEIFKGKALPAYMALTDASGDLKKNTDDLAQSHGKAKEAAEAVTTPLDKLKTSFGNLGMTIGGIILNDINPFLKSLNDMVSGLDKVLQKSHSLKDIFSQANPRNGLVPGIGPATVAPYGSGAFNPSILTPGSGAYSLDSHQIVNGNQPLIDSIKALGHSVDNLTAKQQDAMNFLTSKGYSKAGAAAIVGNLTAESNLNPQAAGDKVNGIPTSFGIAQWHNGRANAIQNFMGTSFSHATEDQELAALVHELEGMPSLNNLLKTSTNPNAAAGAFARQFERPANPDAQATARGNIATKIFNAYGSSNGDNPQAVAVNKLKQSLEAVNPTLDDHKKKLEENQKASEDAAKATQESVQATKQDDAATLLSLQTKYKLTVEERTLASAKANYAAEQEKIKNLTVDENSKQQLLTASTAQYYNELRKLQKQLNDNANATITLNKAQQQGQAILNTLSKATGVGSFASLFAPTAQEQQRIKNYQQSLADLEREWRKGTIGLDEYKARLGEITKEYGAFGPVATEAINQVSEYGFGQLTKFSDGFIDSINGTKTSFKDMARSMVIDIEKIIAKLLIQLAIQTAINALTGGSGFAFGGVSKVLGVGDGFAGSLGFAAAGGPVSDNRPYIVGENGPELFVPNTSGSIVTNNDLNSMASGNKGPGVTVVNNINISPGIQGTVRAELQAQLPNLTKQISKATIQSIQSGGPNARAVGIQK